MDFKQLAQQFVDRVQKSAINPTTEVNLVVHSIDANNRPVPPFKMSLVPVTKVNFPGRPERAKEFARDAHLDSICGNINALVPHVTDQLVMIRDGPAHPVKIVTFELEITDPTAA